MRIGEDIPVHGVLRFNEVSATRAAAAAGIAPALIHSEPGALVTRFVEGRTLSAEDVRAPAMLERIVPLLGRCHREIPRVLRGAVPMFWVFHVVRDYAATLRDGGSRYEPQLAGLLARADELEAAVGPIDVVFGHNDLLAANFIDDGARLWLVDWEYAGFNSPLFDLGGLASNSELAPEQEDRSARTLLRSARRCRAEAALPGDEVRVPAAREHVVDGVRDSLRARCRPIWPTRGRTWTVLNRPMRCSQSRPEQPIEESRWLMFLQVRAPSS